MDQNKTCTARVNLRTRCYGKSYFKEPTYFWCFWKNEPLVAVTALQSRNICTKLCHITAARTSWDKVFILHFYMDKTQSNIDATILQFMSDNMLTSLYIFKGKFQEIINCSQNMQFLEKSESDSLLSGLHPATNSGNI